jgi:hypothetical protein
VRSWTWAGASIRGTSHERSGTPCQDAHKCAAVGETLIAIVADGAGSAEFGGQGAKLICRSLLQQATDHYSRNEDAPSDEVLWTWIDSARDRIALAAERRAALPRAFASTLVLVLAGSAATTVVHVGDGAAALRMCGEVSWLVPSWPAHGEYASTTFFLTDDPAPRVRIERLDTVADALVLFTDGLERLALSFSDCSPYRPFFDNICKPLVASTVLGRDASLVGQLSSYLQ